MRPPTGETWPRFLWGGVLAEWNFRRTTWHARRLTKARRSVQRHEAELRRLQAWARAEKRKLRG